MYRVIFLFDIGDLYPSLREAIDRLHERRRAKNLDWPDHHLAVVMAWLRRVLREDIHLILTDHCTDHQTLLDGPFLNETMHVAARVYRQLAPAVVNHPHPCVESWCAVHVSRNTLYLTFDVGPIDYGARLTEELPCI